MSDLFEAKSVKPVAERYEMIMTFDSAVSHHDPAVQDDSNVLLFNRQKQIAKREGVSGTLTETAVKQFAEKHLVPVGIKEIFEELTFPEFVAVAVVRHFADTYNSADGTGVFEGLNRWQRLEARVKQSAIQSVGLRGFWDVLTRRMSVPVPHGRDDAALLSFILLPKVVGSAALKILALNSNSTTSLARVWHSQSKVAVKEETDFATLNFDTNVEVKSSRITLEVPAVSNNSIRHCTLRAAGWAHLAGALGLKGDDVGLGQLPLGAEAMFVNGGNIAAGAKAPNDPFAITTAIRNKYPLLDLLGGVTDSFDIGASLVRVNSYIVCAENAEMLKGTSVEDSDMIEMSVFDMLDDVTHTRQAVNGRGQMIYNFETLCAGVQIYTRYTLAPYIKLLTKGAFAAALDTFENQVQAVGGQIARGFGSCRVDLARHELDEFHAEYLKYLHENKEELRKGLVEGDLCSGHLVVS